MKRQLLILLFYLGNTNLFAQDLTIKQLITKAENAIFTVFAAMNKEILSHKEVVSSYLHKV